MTNPNEVPFVPQVHDEQRASTTTGMLQDQQRGMRGKLIESIMQLVVQAVTGVFLPGPLGTAFSQLSTFFSTLLPDQILQPLRDLVDILVGVLDSIPLIGPPLGDVLEDLAALFGLLNDKSVTAQNSAVNAQASADSANVGVSQVAGQLSSGNVPSGGYYFTDTFGVAGPNLGVNYVQGNGGPGGGNFQPDGANAVIIPSGSGGNEAYAFLVTPSNTDNQAIALVQDSAIPNILTPPYIRVCLRMDAGRANCVLLTIGLNFYEIGKIIANSYTALLNVSDANAPGDLWTFKAGTDVDSRELVVIHNTGTPQRVIDSSGTPHNVGSLYRHGQFNEAIGLQYIPPFFTGQVQPPAIQSITFYDRLPADV